MASFSFGSEVSLDSVVSERTKEHFVASQVKKRIVEETLRKAEEDRLQKHSFVAISQYLKETNEINYETFLTLRDIAPRNAKQYFSAKVFLLLCPDQSGYISSEALIRYIHRSMNAEDLILHLTWYAAGNADISFLTSEQLHVFIHNHIIGQIDPRRQMDESFYEFYASTAAAKFLFHLDPRKTQQISVRAMVHSPVMQELQRLCQLLVIQDDSLTHGQIDEIERNWFNYENVVNLYKTFLQLDVDRNGFLSMQELEAFRGHGDMPVQFTPTAVQRIAEQLIIYVPFELDFRGFVYLILALEDIQRRGMDEEGEGIAGLMESFSSPSLNPRRRSHRGLEFFWRIVDFDHTGKLSPMKIKHFLRDVLPELTRMGQYDSGEVPRVHTIIGEIYDMLGYRSPQVDMLSDRDGPTFTEIVNSGQGETVVLMLLDVQAFYRYEIRESLVHQPSNEDDTGSQLAPGDGQSQSETVAKPTTVPQRKFDFSNIRFDDEEEGTGDDDYNF